MKNINIIMNNINIFSFKSGYVYIYIYIYIFKSGMIFCYVTMTYSYILNED